MKKFIIIIMLLIISIFLLYNVSAISVPNNPIHIWTLDNTTVAGLTDNITGSYVLTTTAQNGTSCLSNGCLINTGNLYDNKTYLAGSEWTTNTYSDSTISFWFNTTWDTIIYSRGGNGVTSYLVNINKSGNLDDIIINDGPTMYNSTFVISKGKWHNFIFTWSIIGGSQIYIDGNLSLNYSGVPVKKTEPDYDLLGDYHTNAIQTGNVSYDLLVQYNRVLNQNEINRLQVIVPYEINNYNFNYSSYETSHENFYINLSYNSNIYNSIVYLVYNNVSYLTNQQTYGQNSIFTKELDIPLINQSIINNTFYWNITLTSPIDGFSYSELSPQYNQTVRNINFSLCGISPININYLNFTVFNESSTNKEINSTFYSTFWYWLGTGNTKKNYSYIDANQNMSKFKFCFSPNSSNIKIDSDISYGATGFADNEYYFRNATMTNQSTLINLYLVPNEDATKFYVNVKDGVSVIDNAIVTVAKYNPGTGIYSTDSVKLTDGNGQFPLYAYLDQRYQFSIVKNGVLLGVVEKTASCAASPCTISINIQEFTDSVFSGYGENYASNIISNLPLYLPPLVQLD